MGAQPDTFLWNPDGDMTYVVQESANLVLDSVYRNAWTAVGFWLTGDGYLLVEPVQNAGSGTQAECTGSEKECPVIRNRIGPGLYRAFSFALLQFQFPVPFYWPG